MTPVISFAPRVAPHPSFATPQEYVLAARPARPTYTLDLAQITATAAHFVSHFDGKTLFAVKTNPHPAALRALYAGGVTRFDVASLDEIMLVQEAAPHAELYFMHTIKSPETIRAAYFDHGVRRFSLDCIEEFDKIIESTDHAQDLELFVRVALPKNENAAIDFSAKFGTPPADAMRLLRAIRPHVTKLGVCFHVGTQTTDAASYGNAINIVKTIIRDCGVYIDVLDIGGGFPVPYEGDDVPSIENCLDVVRTALHHAGLNEMELIAEPGRCLVAQSGTLITRVEMRKGDMLYLNDGTYGGLFDAGAQLKTAFPVEGVSARGDLSTAKEGFRFAGPTCDSLDMMDGPFMLPADIKTGDWIIVKNAGAYSQSLRTNFNGFGAADMVFVG